MKNSNEINPFGIVEKLSNFGFFYNKGKRYATGIGNVSELKDIFGSDFFDEIKQFKKFYTIHSVPCDEKETTKIQGKFCSFNYYYFSNSGDGDISLLDLKTTIVKEGNIAVFRPVDKIRKDFFVTIENRFTSDELIALGGIASMYYNHIFKEHGYDQIPYWSTDGWYCYIANLKEPKDKVHDIEIELVEDGNKQTLKVVLDMNKGIWNSSEIVGTVMQSEEKYVLEYIYFLLFGKKTNVTINE